jgi:hypothetical protein
MTTYKYTYTHTHIHTHKLTYTPKCTYTQEFGGWDEPWTSMGYTNAHAHTISYTHRSLAGGTARGQAWIKKRIYMSTIRNS